MGVIIILVSQWLKLHLNVSLSWLVKYSVRSQKLSS